MHAYLHPSLIRAAACDRPHQRPWRSRPFSFPRRPPRHPPRFNPHSRAARL